MHPTIPNLGPRLRHVLAVAAIGAGGALVAVAATGGTARSAGAPKPVASKTNLGAGARDVVVLSLVGTLPPRQFRRVGRDGVVEASQFVVPKGSALQVTDIEYVGGWNQPGRGPAQRVLRVEMVNDNDGLKRGTVAYVAPLPSTAPDPGSAIFHVGGNRALTGICVGAGAHLEVDAPELLAVPNGDPLVQPFHGDVVVRGYLVKDR